jgi:hypothetical protein
LKLEFFEDGLDGGPMILLHSGRPGEVADLCAELQTLSEGVDRQLALHELPFVQSVGQCRLLAVSAPADLGVVARAADFVWTLDSESWLQVTELLEPLREPRGGVSFQYLNPRQGPAVIYSTARSW